MRQKFIFLFAAMLLMSLCAKAQSLSYAKTLIKQERYLDAAKQLRPLADGGNAEAQWIAAEMFFEGKGVPKNNAQGIKYATMAAKQGYENAVLLLAKYYDKQGKHSQAIETLTKYTTQYPALLKGQSGVWLSYAYFVGEGVASDTLKASEILDQQENINETLKKIPQLGEPYWIGKAKQIGLKSMSEYYQKTRDQVFRQWLFDMMDLLDADKKKEWYEIWRNEQALGFKAIAAIVSQWAEEGKGVEANLLTAKFLAWMAAESGDSYGKQRYQHLLKDTDFETGEIRPEGIVISTYGPNRALVMMRIPVNIDRKSRVQHDGTYHFSLETGCTRYGLKWYRAYENDYKQLISWMKEYNMELPSGLVSGDDIYSINNGEVTTVRKMKNSDYKLVLPTYLVTTITK